MRNNIIDIEDKIPHEIAELICLYCKYRWIAVFPEGSLLKDWDCPKCKKHGGIIYTGQRLND